MELVSNSSGDKLEAQRIQVLHSWVIEDLAQLLAVGKLADMLVAQLLVGGKLVGKLVALG